MKLSIVDDFQANNKPEITINSVSQNNVTMVLVDDYLANNLNPELLYMQYDPSKYDNTVFVIRIEDDFAKANDEYVLVTEDGFVISMEDYYNQDQVAIVVR
jgi:hypothetical protein